MLTSLTATGSAAIPSTTTAYGSRNKELSSVTDPYNSLTSNLIANAVFTGLPIDISEFAEISVAVYASHSSASNGLQIQFSQDAVSWDVINTLTITSNAESGARFPTHLRYFRVIYTNGATTTTTLRLQTRLHRLSANGTLRKFNDSVLPTDFAQLTRSVLNGRNTPASTSFSDVVVKAASTAAAATDTALVVAVRDALPAGTNNIGDVDVLTLPSIPAGSNTIGNVGLVAGSSTIGNVVAVSTASSTLVNSNSTLGAVTGGVIKNSAGNLFLVSGYNNSSNNIFVQLHNATSAPADGTAPVVTFSVPANSNYSFDWGSWGRYFSTGIYVCGSSTFATKTIITIGTIWVDAQFK